jgi:hypothetical protein
MAGGQTFILWEENYREVRKARKGTFLRPLWLPAPTSLIGVRERKGARSSMVFLTPRSGRMGRGTDTGKGACTTKGHGQRYRTTPGSSASHSIRSPRAEKKVQRGERNSPAGQSHGI